MIQLETNMLGMGMMLGMDPWYFLIVLIPGMLLSGAASWLVKSRFNHYSKIPSTRGYTGQMAAQKLLDQAGIHDVQVVRVQGFLSDHYNPRTKQLALSPPYSTAPALRQLELQLMRLGMLSNMRRAITRSSGEVY